VLLLVKNALKSNNQDKGMDTKSDPQKEIYEAPQATVIEMQPEGVIASSSSHERIGGRGDDWGGGWEL
jgi:hypothetical protein